jgi:ribonuclease E
VRVEVLPEGENEGAKMRVASSGPRNEFVPQFGPIVLEDDDEDLPEDEDIDEEEAEEASGERNERGDEEGRSRRGKRRRGGRGRDRDRRDERPEGEAGEAGGVQDNGRCFRRKLRA